MNKDKQLVNAAFLAKRYGATLTLIRIWAKDRKIPSYRISHRCVRFDVEACDKAIDKFLVEEQV